MATLFLDGIDLAWIELMRLRLQNLASHPGSPQNGWIYYNTTDHTVYLRADGAWVDVIAGLGGYSDADARAAIATAINAGTLTGIDFDVSGAAFDLAVTDSPTVAGQTPANLRDRATHTGTQTASTISDFDTQVRTSRLDQMAAPAANVAMGSNRITGLADGTAATDAATLGQVTAAVTAQTWKDPVRAATTANITLSGTQTVDGVALAVGDRVLVKNQSTPSQNGIYVVAAGAWTRATDLDAPAEFTNATVLVRQGAVAQGDIFKQTAVVTTVGTDAVTWAQIAEGNTVYTADGTTITLTGTQFAVGVINIVTNTTGTLTVARGGTGAVTLTSNGVLLGAGTSAVTATSAGTANQVLRVPGGGGAPAFGQIALNQAAAVTGTLPVANGGTGGATAAAARTALSAVGKASGSLTGGSTSEVLTHNLNTRDVEVIIRNHNSPWDRVYVTDEATTVNTVTIRAASNLPAGYRWTVIG
jgi:hypothetical protein